MNAPAIPVAVAAMMRIVIDGGSTVGDDDGSSLGALDTDGMFDGRADTLGDCVGRFVGKDDGSIDIVGEADGFEDG